MGLQMEDLVINCGISCFADVLTEYAQGALKLYLQAPMYIF